MVEKPTVEGDCKTACAIPRNGSLLGNEIGKIPGNKISFGVARYLFNYNPLRKRRCRIPPNDIGSFGYWAATSLRG